MNRTIALFLALAVLSAHALAIYQAGNGDLAPPYEFAHVAYRIGRNLAQTGRLTWDSSLPSCEAYPSLLWVGISALAERTYSSVTLFTQGFGAVCALLTVLVVAQFSPDRLAGVIAPLLLVVSGGLAASALSGTEIPLLALLVTLSFLSFERRWRWPLALLLPLTLLARPEGALFVLALFVLELVGSLRNRSQARTSVLGAFAPAFATGLAVIGVRWSGTGHALSPAFEALIFPNWTRLHTGVDSLRDVFVGLGAPTLVIFPLWYVARGTLVGTGRRALSLFAVWALFVACGGGGFLPFAGEMVPVLPLLYVSIQEAMTLALDSSRRGLPQLSWTLFAIGMVTSSLASKYPGNLGPLPVENLHRGWQTAAGRPQVGHSRVLGRLGLHEELRLVERVRAAGIFLRDHIDPTFTILSPWPGAIGYLSQLRVLDPLGRVTPLPGSEDVRPWSAALRTDIARVIEEHPEYIVPTLTTSGTTPRADDIVEAWARAMDGKTLTEERAGQLLRALAAYEMIAVPLEYEGRLPSVGAGVFFLLRLRELDLGPTLFVEVKGSQYTIEVEHDSHEQLADLEVELRDEDGHTWSMRPTGEFTTSPVLARTNLLLFPTEHRRVLLARGQIPPELGARELRVALRNPSAQGNDIFTNVGHPVAWSW